MTATPASGRSPQTLNGRKQGASHGGDLPPVLLPRPHLRTKRGTALRKSLSLVHPSDHATHGSRDQNGAQSWWRGFQRTRRQAGECETRTADRRARLRRIIHSLRSVACRNLEAECSEDYLRALHRNTTRHPDPSSWRTGGARNRSGPAAWELVDEGTAPKRAYGPLRVKSHSHPARTPARVGPRQPRSTSAASTDAAERISRLSKGRAKRSSKAADREQRRIYELFTRPDCGSAAGESLPTGHRNDSD